MRRPSSYSVIYAGTGRGSRSIFIFALYAWFVLCLACGMSNGQSSDETCRRGNGKFAYKFTTGVTVQVGAVKNAGFAQRACAAKLLWGKQELEVTPQAWGVDVDTLGADMTLGGPVVAFQIKKQELDGRREYRIYSLQSPRLLRTLHDGDYYNAADTDMDGRVEIWTDDAAAVDGFEGIPLSAYDFVPTVVLRFEQKKLLDVSAQFASNYNDRIAALKSQIGTSDLNDFSKSDGRLQSGPSIFGEKLHRLVQTKIKVMEIVWAYLYSGREKDAWQTLETMWPATDVERIRALMIAAKSHGIQTEIDGVGTAPSLLHGKQHATVYDASSKLPALSSFDDHGEAVNVPDEKPVAILLYRPEPIDPEALLRRGEERIDLVIDAAGKIRSTKFVGETEDKELMAATAGWKFIPAFKGDHAVACRLLFEVQNRK